MGVAPGPLSTQRMSSQSWGESGPVRACLMIVCLYYQSGSIKPLLRKRGYYFKRQFATGYHDDNVSPISFARRLRALKMLCNVIGFFSLGSKLSRVYYVPNVKEQQDKPLPPASSLRESQLFLAPANPLEVGMMQKPWPWNTLKKASSLGLRWEAGTGWEAKRLQGSRPIRVSDAV